MMNFFLLLLVAVGPVLAIGVLFYLLDSNDREPFKYLISSFILGALMVVPVYLIQKNLPEIGIAPGNSFWGTILYVFVGVAFVEELAKFLPLRFYAYPKRAFNEPFDGIIYSVMVALGFVTVENCLYIFNEPTHLDALNIGLGRLYTAVPAHVLFAVIMGYNVGIGKYKFYGSKFMNNLRGLFAATFLHGLYNIFLFFDRPSWLFIISFVILVLALVYAVMAIRIHRDISDKKFN